MSIFFRASLSPAVERAILIVVLSALALLCWIVLWKGGDFAHVIHNLGAHHHGSHTVSFTNYMAIFIAGWSVMTVAMMLPTTIPIIAFFHKFTENRADRILLLSLVVMGYVGTWIVFGVLIYFGILLIKMALSSFSVLSGYTWAGPPIIIIAAGLFQFTELKYKCLDKCRSPLSFIMEHWKDKNEKWNAFMLGVDHGIFCIGCCWALMLLMFAVGFGSLLWMLVLALVMGIEKNVRWGRKIGKPVGFILLISGLSMLIYSYSKIY
jgi:predicted metal-binding membrane protein